MSGHVCQCEFIRATLTVLSPCHKASLYLVHHGGLVPVGFPAHSLVAVVNAVALHKHFSGERHAALGCYCRYLLNSEQINLQPLFVVVRLQKSFLKNV